MAGIAQPVGGQGEGLSRGVVRAGRGVVARCGSVYGHDHGGGLGRAAVEGRGEGGEVGVDLDGGAGPLQGGGEPTGMPRTAQGPSWTGVALRVPSWSWVALGVPSVSGVQMTRCRASGRGAPGAALGRPAGW